MERSSHARKPKESKSSVSLAPNLFALGLVVVLTSCAPNTIQSACGPLFVSGPISYALAKAMDKACELASSDGSSSETEPTVNQDSFADHFKAAEQGDANSQYKLGTIYEKGDGVSQNSVQAYKWFTVAAVQGHLSAEQSREDVAANMTADQTDEAERLAREWMIANPQKAELDTDLTSDTPEPSNLASRLDSSTNESPKLGTPDSAHGRVNAVDTDKVLAYWRSNQDVLKKSIAKATGEIQSGHLGFQDFKVVSAKLSQSDNRHMEIHTFFILDYASIGQHPRGGSVEVGVDYDTTVVVDRGDNTVVEVRPATVR